MSFYKSLCVATALAVSSPIAAFASTLLESITVDYTNNGTTGGQIINDPSDPQVAVFVQNFDFTNGLSSFNIDRFDITLNVIGVGALPADGVTTFGVDGATIGGIAANGSDNTLGTENWFADIAGGAGGANTAFWRRLPADSDPVEPFTYSLSAANDNSEFGADRVDGINNTAFTRSVNQDQIKIRFREASGGLDDQFELLSITVDVYEIAPIPLPASGFLLLGAVGGMAAWKRRKAKA